MEKEKIRDLEKRIQDIVFITPYLRILGEAEQDSGMMPNAIPG